MRRLIDSAYETATALVTFAGLCCVMFGCASTPAPARPLVPTLTSADARGIPTSEKNEPSTIVASAAEPRGAEEPKEEPCGAAPSDGEPAPPVGAGDPLGMSDVAEDDAPVTIVMTPASRLRRITAAQLGSALQVVSSAPTFDEAVSTLVERLGEPSWTEAPKSWPASKRRVWVAQAVGQSCHRLVLEPDRAATIASASKNERRMLTAAIRQNPCTGELDRVSILDAP